MLGSETITIVEIIPTAAPSHKVPLSPSRWAATRPATTYPSGWKTSAANQS